MNIISSKLTGDKFQIVRGLFATKLLENCENVSGCRINDAGVSELINAAINDNILYCCAIIA